MAIGGAGLGGRRHRAAVGVKGNCHNLRYNIGEPLERANRLPVAAVVAVVRVVEARIEVRPISAAVAVRVRHGRPVVAVRTGTVERSPVAAAGTGEEDAVRSIITFTLDNISINTVHRRPSPIAVIVKVFKFLFCRHTPIAAPVHMRGIMFGSKNSLRCYPTVGLKRCDIFAVSRGLTCTERKISRRSVACHPSIVLALIPHGITPPEVVSEIFGLLSSDIRRRPIRPAFPKLHLVVLLLRLFLADKRDAAFGRTEKLELRFVEARVLALRAAQVEHGRITVFEVDEIEVIDARLGEVERLDRRIVRAVTEVFEGIRLAVLVRHDTAEAVVAAAGERPFTRLGDAHLAGDLADVVRGLAPFAHVPREGNHAVREVLGELHVVAEVDLRIGCGNRIIQPNGRRVRRGKRVVDRVGTLADRVLDHLEDGLILRIWFRIVAGPGAGIRLRIRLRVGFRLDRQLVEPAAVFAAVARAVLGVSPGDQVRAGRKDDGIGLPIAVKSTDRSHLLAVHVEAELVPVLFARHLPPEGKALAFAVDQLGRKRRRAVRLDCAALHRRIAVMDDIGLDSPLGIATRFEVGSGFNGNKIKSFGIRNDDFRPAGVERNRAAIHIRQILDGRAARMRHRAAGCGGPAVEAAVRSAVERGKRKVFAVFRGDIIGNLLRSVIETDGVAVHCKDGTHRHDGIRRRGKVHDRRLVGEIDRILFVGRPAAERIATGEEEVRGGDKALRRIVDERLLKPSFAGNPLGIVGDAVGDRRPHRNKRFCLIHCIKHYARLVHDGAVLVRRPAAEHIACARIGHGRREARRHPLEVVDPAAVVTVAAGIILVVFPFDNVFASRPEYELHTLPVAVAGDRIGIGVVHAVLTGKIGKNIPARFAVDLAVEEERSHTGEAREHGSVFAVHEIRIGHRRAGTVGNDAAVLIPPVFLIDAVFEVVAFKSYVAARDRIHQKRFIRTDDPQAADFLAGDERIDIPLLFGAHVDDAVAFDDERFSIRLPFAFHTEEIKPIFDCRTRRVGTGDRDDIAHTGSERRDRRLRRIDHRTGGSPCDVIDPAAVASAADVAILGVRPGNNVLNVVREFEHHFRPVHLAGDPVWRLAVYGKREEIELVFARHLPVESERTCAGEGRRQNGVAVRDDASGTHGAVACIGALVRIEHPIAVAGSGPFDLAVSVTDRADDRLAPVGFHLNLHARRIVVSFLRGPGRNRRVAFHRERHGVFARINRISAVSAGNRIVDSRLIVARADLLAGDRHRCCAVGIGNVNLRLDRHRTVRHKRRAGLEKRGDLLRLKGAVVVTDIIRIAGVVAVHFAAKIVAYEKMLEFAGINTCLGVSAVHIQNRRAVVLDRKHHMMPAAAEIRRIAQRGGEERIAVFEEVDTVRADRNTVTDVCSGFAFHKFRIGRMDEEVAPGVDAEHLLALERRGLIGAHPAGERELA